MPNATTQDDLSGFLHHAIHRLDLERGGQQIEVSEGRTSADETIASDDAHLQARILRDDAIFHNNRHEQGRPERQKAAVTDHTQHHLTTLGNIDVIADIAVAADRTASDGAIVAY